MARKTNVRQHTRTVRGRQCNVVHHQRSLKPNLGRVAMVHARRLESEEGKSKRARLALVRARRISHEQSSAGKNVVAPNFTTTKYFKNESWEAVDFKDGVYTLTDGKGNTEYATPEEVGERSVKFPKKQIKALNTARFLEVMEGGEVWTNAFGDRFGERVCVGFEKGKIIHGGKRFTPSAKEMEELKHDVAIAEWGTADPKKIMKLEGF